jgi:hypothetical protein
MTRTVISESFPGRYRRFNRFERAIFSGPYKFISSTAGKKELYDLSKDPNEEENLYSPDDHICEELETKLTLWLENTSKMLSSPDQLDERTIDRLKSLGYAK